MIGIIGAMDAEVDSVKNRLENAVNTVYAGIDFVCGELEGEKVCAAQCRPGKVNAALCTQLMIDRFSPSGIINIGVGCSLSEDTIIKDTVIASRVCQYDFDTSAIDGVKGLVFDGMTSFPADDKLTRELAEAAKSVSDRVHIGCIASGDTFIASQELKDRINREFGAICGEMEGGAVGHVCYANGVPFAVLRTISDGGDGAAQIDYPEFKLIASEISADILIAFIKNKASA